MPVLAKRIVPAFILEKLHEIRTRTEIAIKGAEHRWAGLQGDEVSFWEEQIRAGSMPRMNANRPLQPYVAELIDAKLDSRIQILDVGSGPMTILGDQWPPHEVRITAVDPNAPQYDLLLTKYGIVPPCRTRFGYMEDLASVVPNSFFDLVHARNCVDHSKDPLKAIREMIRAAKPGCRVFLNHYIAEGQKNHYAGPHQWNLYSEKRRFFIHRPGARPIDVGEKLAGVADLHIGASPHGKDWFAVTITRHD